MEGYTKGQIISKRFLVSSDSSKNERTNSILVLLGKKRNLFVRFLEESADTKSRFEIIWPLVMRGLGVGFCLAEATDFFLH